MEPFAGTEKYVKFIDYTQQNSIFLYFCCVYKIKFVPLHPKINVMEILSRSYYAKKIDSWLGSGLIIVLIGQRRVGKIYVMKYFIARHEKEADANIIYIDKEKRSFRFISNCKEGPVSGDSLSLLGFVIISILAHLLYVR